MQVPFYKAYRATKDKEVCPAGIKNKRRVEDKISVEADGIAIFDDNKLVAYMSAEETKYFLYAMDEIDGGLLVFSNFSKD